MKYKVVVFDWDGTLIDSVEHIAGSLQKAAQALGFPVRSLDAYRDIIGLGMVEALEKLYPGIDRMQMQALRDQYASQFFSQQTSPSHIFPGIADLLDRLRTADVQLAVATGKSRRGLDRALASTGLGRAFGVTRCADETLSKPDPLMLNQILGHYGIEPEQAVMVGDTVYDLDMAQRAGMPSIGVTWGVHGAGQLQDFDPVAVVGGVEALSSALTD